MLTQQELKKCEKECRAYINAVKKSIEQKYGGKVPAEFVAQLRQLDDMYLCYLQCSHEFRQSNDIIVKKSNGKAEFTQVNQLFALMLQIADKMDKLVKNFGISPLAASKIKGLPTGSDGGENFLESL